MSGPGADPQPAASADFPGILALNLAFEHWLSPMDAARLQRLHAMQAYHRVIREGDEVLAFLLGFREGVDYDSPNYRWFGERYPQFLYIDRVVVAASAQGRQLGQRLYRDLFDVARQQGVGLVCCEFDLEPPNPGSEQFHRRLGFVEVGRQPIHGGRKQVSLQALRLDPV